MRNRTYGGVRGRKTKVGRKLLRFPPTQFYLLLDSSFYKMVYHLSFLFPHDCGDEMSAAAAFSKLA